MKARGAKFWLVSISVHSGVLAAVAAIAPVPVPVREEAPVVLSASIGEPSPALYSQCRRDLFAEASKASAEEEAPPHPTLEHRAEANRPVSEPDQSRCAEVLIEASEEPACLATSTATKAPESTIAVQQPGNRAASDSASSAPAPELTASGAEAIVAPGPHRGNPLPTYPRAARLAGTEGTVTLRLLVTEKGTVASAEIAESSGSKVLDEAARNTLERWRFSPAHRGQTALSYWVVVPVAFRLSGVRT